MVPQKAHKPQNAIRQPHLSDIAPLENGIALREWIEKAVQEMSFKTIRCATYAISAPGLQWLLRLARDHQAHIRLLSDGEQTDPQLVRSITATMFASGEIECRIAPARPGPVLNEKGLFHPKILILDETVAVVGSVNLTGKGLGVGIQPHNVEMSIGLSGTALQSTIRQLVEIFDRWWKDSQLLWSHLDHQNKKESQHMAQPEYVVFRDRPLWGIAQVQQNEGSNLFGQEQWLAVSDISPVDPEHCSAHIRIPDQSVEVVKPKSWDTPAVQFAREGVDAVSNSKEHFRRLAAYWLQAENLQGQLDSLPVLQLRHQTSLVEYLSGTDVPRQMLIADEVGLGKTVEMGLLLERLKAAKPDLRVLYVTPGSLVTNVIDEFKNMGLPEFYVFANRSLDEKKYPQARLGREEHDPRVVASLHRLGNRSNPENYLKDTHWDVVIADECHRLRMYGAGDSQKAQKWYRLFERIIGNHLAKDGRVYFLSGTPHQGNREVFLNLIFLMCGLGRGASQLEKQQALDGQVIYRIKEEMHDWDNQPVFPKRNIRDPNLADNPPKYDTLLSEIAEFFNWVRHNANNKKQALGFVKSQALQYAASSPKAGFAFLLRRYLRYFADETNEETLLKWVSLLIPYRQRSRKQKPKQLLEELLKSVKEIEKETESDYDEDDDLGDSVGPAGVDEMRQEEKQRLSQLLRKYALFMPLPQAKAKFEVLKELLDEADEPFVVFAQSLDTVYEIKRHVEQLGIPCCLIVGGQDPSERRKAIDDFTKPGRLGRRVLVSSAAGGEGINLQIARRLIHFDLPWNPMVLEQRIGRVHRIGTIDTIIVDTILLRDSREADIYGRLRQRLLTIVNDLTESEIKRAEYFRRIIAGIPLEILRNLFSGQVDDDAAIGAAVDEGKQRVDQVDAELRRHSVTELPDEKGRASMELLVELLKESGKITELSAPVDYNKVRYDSATDSFQSQKGYASRYRIDDGQRKEKNPWIVFDREAAALSPDVDRDKSGGINHPLIAIALQTLRTAEDIDDMSRLTLGLGTYDKEFFACFSDHADEPVVLLSYLVAHLRDEHFFNHELRLFALSPSNPKPEELKRTEDGELVEDIIWTNLRKDSTKRSCPDLDQNFLKEISSQDGRIREDLGSEVRDEEGRWRGAVWPLAATVLLPSA